MKIDEVTATIIIIIIIVIIIIIIIITIIIIICEEAWEPRGVVKMMVLDIKSELYIRLYVPGAMSGMFQFDYNFASYSVIHDRLGTL